MDQMNRNLYELLQLQRKLAQRHLCPLWAVPTSLQG